MDLKLIEQELNDISYNYITTTTTTQQRHNPSLTTIKNIFQKQLPICNNILKASFL